MKDKIKNCWAVRMALQFLFIALLSAALTALSLAFDAWVYDVAMWGVAPALGAASAFWSVRHGLHYMAAWIAPPVGQALGHLLLTGYVPSSAGMVMLCAACAMVAAAAAEELERRKAKGK